MCDRKRFPHPKPTLQKAARALPRRNWPRPKFRQKKTPNVLANFDKMIANLGDAQKQFMKAQRDALVKKADTSRAEVSKLEMRAWRLLTVAATVRQPIMA